MASRSSGVGWFVVGLLAGVGATLAAIIFATRPQPTHVAIPSAPTPAAPVVTYHAPAAPYGQAPAAPAASAAPVAPPPSYASGPAAQPDSQTQEDAAAAGMTSRAHRGE